ncbi:hypothetical protein IE077_001975, partial [Cardiosporidium cionae]
FRGDICVTSNVVFFNNSVIFVPVLNILPNLLLEIDFHKAASTFQTHFSVLKMQKTKVDVQSRWDEDEAVATLDILYELSLVLDTGLDKSSLQLLVQLIEWGIHPEALANTMLELQTVLRNLKVQELQKLSDISLQSSQNHPILASNVLNTVSSLTTASVRGVHEKHPTSAFLKQEKN